MLTKLSFDIKLQKLMLLWVKVINYNLRWSVMTLGYQIWLKVIKSDELNLEVLKYSLEQYIGFVGRLAFIHYCGLHQVWLEAEN